MNTLPIHNFPNFALSFFSENLDSFLTPQNKKIVTIAAIAFAALAALYLFGCCCCEKELALLRPDEKFEYPDGTEAVGKFYEENYSTHFKGKQTDFEGIAEEGIFSGSKYHTSSKMQLEGQGKRAFPDGAVWEGHFSNGQLKGKGKKILADGTVEEGNFHYDTLSGKGKVTIPKGDTIEGFFNNGKLNGYGKITHADGTVDEGIFTDGVLTKKKPKPNQSTTTTANAPTPSAKADPFASSPEE